MKTPLPRVTNHNALAAILILATGLAVPCWAAVSVTSPAYRADISGNTTIQISAPGATSATVKCWQSDTGLGHDTTVATVTLSGGNGSFVFPSASYPHGPLVIRITAGTDTCYFQAYNTGGVSWKEGLAAAPVPSPAQGMTVAFSDDFTGALSISRTGAGATYGSHTVGYKDFSGIKFQDYEGAVNPFLRKDSYLRIRADETNNSTGLICSVAQDKTGFKVRPPFYMECRFIAQRATGSWPAFWAPSIPNGSEEYAELDVIEAYGNLTQKRYTAGIHNWPSDSARAYSLILMDGSIPGTSAAEWSDTPHTYGCNVTATTTTFYLDNVAVWSTPTRSEWNSQDFYFLINYAFGGTSGWPVDLSRYGMQSDMYVDWVRVFVPPATTALPVGTFKIVAKHSGKCLDWRTGWNVVQYADAGLASQKWKTADLGGGQYSIQQETTIKSIQVEAASTADGASIIMKNWLAGNHQRWTGQPASNGYFRLINVNSGKAMEVAGSSTADGALLDQWTIGTGANQEFAFASFTIPVGTFKIVAKHSGKCLDWRTGWNVVQYADAGLATQKWKTADLGGGQYSIQQETTIKSIQVEAASTADGASIIMKNWLAGNHQRWTGQPASSGYFRLINVNSGKAMEVAGSSTADGALLDQWTVGTGANQEFAFQSP
ncbi:MAG: RICIN domain-containing protein [Terrimicrobiaceae bacterium]